MRRETLAVMEIELRRTQALFRAGRPAMAFLLGGSALVVLAILARLALGL